VWRGIVEVAELLLPFMTHDMSELDDIRENYLAAWSTF
jgi:succinate dehydrogenase flavin-adding protein (antitoxin of CptAB toxin-antitoxin module)